MITYKNYLEQQNYSKTTIESYTKSIETFLKWCKRNHTNAELIDYQSILKYIKYLQRKNRSKRTVKHQIGITKSYFKYLLSENYRVDNPIEDVNIKGVKRTINYNLLEADELEDLYYSYQTENIKDAYHRLTAKRNKVIVGLIVYQGLRTTDLGNLKLEHLQLLKGKIYVPSTRKSNARELELKPWQIMEFIEYQNEVRTAIQKRINNYTEQLFPLNTRFSTITYHINKRLKKYNHKVKDLKQIRASVITNWLGQYNLRKVQYLAGHRYISSTERYVQDDLENLHEIVNSFHPIS